MSLPAIESEFESVLARFPSAPDFESALDLARSIENDVDVAFKRFQRALIAWRFKLSVYLPEVEDIFKNVKNNPDEINFLFCVAMPRVMKLIDDSIEVEMNCKNSLLNIQNKLKILVEFSPESEKLIRDIDEIGIFACNAHLKVLEDQRNRLKVIEWDYDPDARGGEVFETAEDLIASLRD